MPLVATNVLLKLNFATYDEKATMTKGAALPNEPQSMDWNKPVFIYQVH